MIALLVNTEEEFNKIKDKIEIEESEIKIPGLYYEHMGEWCTRYLYDAGMMKQFGYILARPV